MDDGSGDTYLRLRETPARLTAKTRKKAVALAPITEADAAAVADFLRSYHNGRVPWVLSCSATPWTVEAPNHGFMLRDEQRVVGTLLALYSERLVDGRVERFSNIGSWCVLPEYRHRSISLLNALLAQEGYHFTVLSPDEGTREILGWFRFRALDTTAAVVPNLPWPTTPGKTRISAEPEVIEANLTGTELELYHDHAQALAAHHLVVIRGQESCYVIYRRSRYKGAPVLAAILHVSNPDLFKSALAPLARHLLTRHGLIATVAELRIIGDKPGRSFTLNRRPKMFRSATLEPGQVDYLYSELVCVPS